MTKKDFCKLSKISSLLMLAAALGCAEEPKTGLSELGLEASPQEINDALYKATSGASIHNARVNQLVHYEDNYRVDLNSVTKITDNIRQLVQIKDNPVTRTYVLNEDYFEYDNSGSVVNEKHSEVAVEYQKNPPTLTQLKAMASSDPDCGKERQSDWGVTFDCIGYYNFKTAAIEEDVPARTKARPDCGNVPGCKIPAQQIQFDRVYFLKNKVVDRENLNFSLSKIVPVLYPEADLLPFNYFCIGRRYEAAETSYWVNRCKVLRDLSL